MRRLCILLLTALILALPAAALEPQEALEEQIGVTAVEEAAEELAGEALFADFEPETALQRLFGKALRTELLSEAVRSAAATLLVLLVCGVVESVFALAERQLQVLRLAGAAAMALLLAGRQQSLLELCCGTVGKLQDFANVLLPALTAAAAASGQFTAAAAKYAAAALFLNLLVNAVQTLVVPLIRLFFAAAAVEAASGSSVMSSAVGFLRWLIGTILTVLMLAFTLYISLTALTSGAADAALVKSAKTLLSASLPLVGGIASDAASAILSSADVIRKTVGVYGLVAVLAAILLPFLRVAAHYLVYRGAATLAAGLGSSPLAGLAKRFSETMGMLLGCLGACGLMLYFSIFSMIGVLGG